jgi:hypothetical protein
MDGCPLCLSEGRVEDLSKELVLVEARLDAQAGDKSA